LTIFIIDKIISLSSCDYDIDNVLYVYNDSRNDESHKNFMWKLLGFNFFRPLVRGVSKYKVILRMRWGCCMDHGSNYQF